MGYQIIDVTMSVEIIVSFVTMSGNICRICSYVCEILVPFSLNIKAEYTQMFSCQNVTSFVLCQLETLSASNNFIIEEYIINGTGIELK